MADRKPCYKTREQVQNENSAAPVGITGGYDYFVEAIKRGVYSALMGEINRIAIEASLSLKTAIKKRGAELALELSNQVALDHMGNELNIKIQIPDIESEEIKEAIFKNLNR
jgi:hypothetical protein